MKNRVTNRRFVIIGSAILIITSAFLYFWYPLSNREKSELTELKELVTQKMEPAEKKAARYEYFFKLMRDPATNQVPPNIRNRELQFAQTLPTAKQALRHAKEKNPSLQAVDYSWEQAGPFDVGGRTRALAVDQRDPDIVLAGGVSGGMWKSTDGGQTWQLKTPDLPNLSVTTVAQDPLNPDTWYYASGEILGNSAGATNAAYYGQGIYKSTDNGESWTLMPQASSSTQGSLDKFNTVSRIVVSATTGSIFISSNGRGIYRSTDGQSFESDPVLGPGDLPQSTPEEPLFLDVAVASNGTLGAVISEATFEDQVSQQANDSPNNTPGIFISTNDGQSGSWTEVTPSDFPDTHRRSVLTFAPSNPDILYVFTLKGAGENSNQGVSFFKIDISDPQNPVADDRSANLPDFRTNGNGSGYVELQGGYNMLVDVKPDNENYVFIGGTNLFRSENGFANTPSGGYDGDDDQQKDKFWIGGYNKNNSFALYPDHHPDQHVIAFPEPTGNPNIMLSGHDGGLSITSDVTSQSVTWENRDRGYITSQFYAADIPESTGDMRLMGGTQDNGTPFFERDGQPNSQNSQDISSADGGYAFFTENYQFVSQQLGRVIRWNKNFSELSYLHPSNAQDQLFIHPYVVDPNDENVMYYPENDHIWRNTAMDRISNNNSSDGTSTGWEELENVSTGSQHTITALAVSTNNPANRLYFGGYNPDLEPVLKRLDNAKNATNDVDDITLPAGNDLSGAYVKDIAINPANSDEVIVVLSNYNIVGLYHTPDGGKNWTAIEGNLTGTASNNGVSLRSATIIPAKSGTIYLLGTSTGLYSTQMLDGSNTTWGQEAPNGIGHAVSEHLASRTTDGNVVVGTHGRGIFYGDFGGTTNVLSISANPNEGRAGDAITIEAKNFQFSSTPSENIVTFGDQRTTVLDAYASELEVEVPRNALGRRTQNNSVTITAKTNDQSLSTTFQLLPPNDFTLKQNYPNPFNPTTTIPFDIPVRSDVTLTIYNINGQKVLEPLQRQTYNPGAYDVSVDLSGLASGVYIYRLFVRASSGQDDALQTKKMTLIK